MYDMFFSDSIVRFTRKVTKENVSGKDLEKRIPSFGDDLWGFYRMPSDINANPLRYITARII